MLWRLLAVGLAAAATAAAADVGHEFDDGYDHRGVMIKLQVSVAMPLISHTQMQHYKVGYPDASLVVVKDTASRRFWMDGAAGPASTPMKSIDGIPGRPWSFMAGGGGRQLTVQQLVAGDVGYYKGYSKEHCPTFDGFSYKAGCVTDADDWKGGKALMWIGNVYKDQASGGILGFIHMEFSDPRPAAEMCYFRFGLGWSENGGKNFTWLDYILEPSITYNHSMFGSKYNRPRWYPNIGLPAYIVKDGYFHIYYGDTHGLATDGSIQNTSNSGAGNPDQGVAVVRAKVADVIAAAKQHKGVKWKKRFQGDWTEPGMGGKFTPLSIAPEGYMHGDAAYCKPLDKFVMVQQSGGRIQQTHAWRQAILLSFSSDGLEWSAWQVVVNVTQLPGYKGGQVTYPSLVSLENNEDNEVLGSTFAVVFQLRAGNSSNPPFQFVSVNVTVSSSNASESGSMAQSQTWTSLKNDDDAIRNPVPSVELLPQWEVVSSTASPVIGPDQTVRHGVFQGFETGHFFKIRNTYYVAINELGLCEKVVWDRTTRAALWSAPNASGPWQRITTLRNTSSMHTLCKLPAGEGLPNACSWAPTLVHASSIVNGSTPVWNLFYSACEDLGGAPSPDPRHPKDKPGDGIVHSVSTTASMHGPYVDVPSSIVPGSGVVVPFSHAFTTWRLPNGTYMSFRNNAPTATILPSGRPDFSVGLERAIANGGTTLGGPWAYNNNTVPFPCGPENPIVSVSSDGQWYYAVYDALEQLPVGHDGQVTRSSVGPGAGPGCSDPSSKYM
jgi:hypothetical protein